MVVLIFRKRLKTKPANTIKGGRDLKRLSAFLFIAVLCLSMLSVFMIEKNFQFFSAGDPVKVTQLWQFDSLGDYDYPSISSPSWHTAMSTLLLRAAAHSICLDSSTGTQIWNVSAAGSFTVANGYIYDAVGGDVLCLSALSGVQLWNFSHAVAFGVPNVVGGVVYVGGLNSTLSPNDVGCIYALNASTGTKIWDYFGPDRNNLFLIGISRFSWRKPLCI